MHHRVAADDWSLLYIVVIVIVGVWNSPTRTVLAFERHWLLLFGFGLWLGLFDIACWRAHFARAVRHIAILVGTQPQQMREEFHRAPEAFLGALGVAV